MYVLRFLSFSIHNGHRIEKMSEAVYIPSDETSSDADLEYEEYKGMKELVSNSLTGNHFSFQYYTSSKFIFLPFVL